MKWNCAFSLMTTLFLGIVAEAKAYDTGHHSDLTREAMAEQGFSDVAIQVSQVENWLVDYYSTREAGVEDSIQTECNKLHADDLLNEKSVKNYWDRYTINAKAAFAEAATNNNPRQVLALLGMSLHTVQDFYSHSNWAEIQLPPGGFDYSTLTYFDASASSRARVKTGRSSRNETIVPDQERHGGYTTGMNHDWYGKPNWDRSYVHAYAGSRQWVNQARLWVSEVNPAVWEQAKNIALTSKQRTRLVSDLSAAYLISLWAKDPLSEDDGHWKGNGSGDLRLFLQFSAAYIAGRADSSFAEDFKGRHWHQLLSGGLRGSLDLGVDSVVNPDSPSPAPPPSPSLVPQMTVLPINKRAVFLKTVSVKDLDDIDPIPFDEADFYANITINNQRFVESTQNGHDSLSPPWITMKFVDADIPLVAIRYELWDEDDGGHENLDIEPRVGVTNLDFLYNMNTERSGGIGIDGVFNNRDRLLVSRGTPGDHAEVKIYVATRTLGPAGSSGPVDWSGLNNQWRNIGSSPHWGPPSTRGMRGAPVAAVSRNPNRLDLFIAGNVRVHTSWWQAGADWSGLGDRWKDIGGPFPNGTPITAVARDPNKIDLFITGKDGRVYTSWWSLGNDWSGINDRWKNIGGIFPRGGPVAALARNPNALDLFITGDDGRVYTSWWRSGSDWSGLGDRWKNIGGIFPPGAPVTGVARDPNKIDLFITGNDGRVYTSWWHLGSDWSGINDRWKNIGGVFPPGAPVTAVARHPNKIDLFITGNDGRVYTSWWHLGSDWSGINDRWRNIGGVFPRGAQVAALARNPNALDLFITGNDGRVYTSWWRSGSDWSGINDRWKDIGGVFPPGAPVTAVSRDPNKIDLFIMGNDARVYTSWWSAD